MKGVARSRTQIHLSGRILKNNEKKEAKNGGWGDERGCSLQTCGIFRSLEKSFRFVCHVTLEN